VLVVHGPVTKTQRYKGYFYRIIESSELLNEMI